VRVNGISKFTSERKELTMDTTFLMFAGVMLAIFIGGLAVYKKSQ